MPKQPTAVRWTVQSASREFGRDHVALAKAIRALDLRPDTDGKFSTRQIASAVFGDIDVERLRKTRQEADRIAIENEKSRGSLIEAEAVYRTYESVFVVLRQKILSLQLPEDDKDELIQELRALKSKVVFE